MVHRDSKVTVKTATENKNGGNNMEGFTTKKQQFATVWKMHTAGDAQWYPAQVPGTVYTDLLRNGQMEDPFWKDNEYRALDLMEKDYEYETVFEGTEAQ